MSTGNLSITTRQEYIAAMKEIEALMKTGEKQITNAQALRLRTLALAAQSYEKNIHKIPGMG